MIQFTGNWYIDMGILGMLNLLKEQLPEKELKDLRSLSDNELKIYFTKCYFKYFIKRKEDKLKEEEKSLNESISKLKNKGDEKSIKKEEQIKEIIHQNTYYKKITGAIEKNNEWFEIKRGIQEASNQYNVTQASKKRIPFSSAFYTNFKFFNNSNSLEKQLNDWEKFIIKGEIDEALEGTLNKLMLSFDAYPNSFFSRPKLMNFISVVDNLQMPLICQFKAYGSRKLAGKYYFFYSPEIDFCFSVNKKIQTLIGNVGSEEKLLSITWQVIFDLLYEYKSEWALQNMYLISYSTINNQQRFEDIEFMGLNKINAAIVGNEKIRENLHQTAFRFLKLKKDDGSVNYGESIKVWLIQEIINDRSLLDLIFRITNVRVTPKKVQKHIDQSKYIVYKRKIITALSIYIHKSIDSKKNMNVFGDVMKQDLQLKNLPGEIIKTTNLIEHHNKLYYSLLEKDENKEQSEFNYLIRLIKRKQNNRFINFIIQKMLIAPNNENNQMAKSLITTFLFKNIINKDVWQYYALGLVFRNFNQISNYEQSTNNE